MRGCFAISDLRAASKAGLRYLQVRDDELLKGYALGIPAEGTEGHGRDTRPKKIISIKPLK